MTLITLSPQEREDLEALAVHTSRAQELRRAQAVLWLNTGEGVSEVAARLRVTRQTIDNWVQRFQQRREHDLPGRLTADPRSGRPRTAHGGIDPLLLEVIDRDPRELGYRSTIWTAPLLLYDLEERHHLRVSRKSVSLAMARLGLRWKRPRHDLARRPATWRQAKGGSNVAWPAGRGRSS
jgi:transposase